MADKMRPVPFDQMLKRIAGEIKSSKSIFGIDIDSFYIDNGKKSLKVFDQYCSTPVGPAAGPHTQLAANIVASYVAGARFIELKTVQIMDTIEVAKPCIDARDECHNTEWSTEYTLKKAFDEYLKAWFVCHIIEGCMHGRIPSTPSFIFNMSVGYSLDGIKNERMQWIINNMIHVTDEKFDRYVEIASSLLSSGLFDGTPYEDNARKIVNDLGNISSHIVDSVTISTMHGCPPEEIEAICSYMLTEKDINTFVKLNPTLLGYDRVREILDNHGFNHVVLKRESFEHDLQMKDALAMLHRLKDLAAKNGRKFGIKITNTLGNVNNGGILPGDERYMSGRALFPVSLEVATVLSKEFNGTLPVSYSGGVSIHNAKQLFEAGIHPLTIATDMLKPGGYNRMTQIAINLLSADGWNREEISVKALESLVDYASKSEVFSKGYRGFNSAKIGRELPLTDCFVAPCIESCPIHQDIPEYIALAGEGRWSEALAVIYLENALPSITGWICDHQCQNHCTRMDYEGPVQIREIKRLATEKGREGFINDIWEKPEESPEVKAAVIGAGPAGLSASLFLARAGFDTYLYEREKSAGGVVKNIIPEFRIPESVVDRDVEFIISNGVKVFFNTCKSVKELKDEGFEYIFIAIGAEKSRDPGIKGNGPVDSAVHVLLKSKRGEKLKLGKNVVVVGGGNTAMDAARMAVRTAGVGSVTVVYRRTKSEMPADIEEVAMAEKDGVKFMFLHNPSDFTDGRLTLSVMELGESDASGRRKPVDTGKTVHIDADFVISAIGESADQAALDAIGSDEGVYVIGDTSTGPSTVVRCIASARNAIEDAIDDVLSKSDYEEEHEHECGCGCSHEEDCEEEDEDIREEENEYFASVNRKKYGITLPAKKGIDPDEFARIEASRCVECSYLCKKCVEVCPNRANAIIDLRDTGLFDDPFQILHIDAYCNECGNCETFCPYYGGPYKKKFTLFSREDDFINSSNDGFLTDGAKLTLRLGGKISEHMVDKGTVVGIDDERIEAFIDEIFSSYSYLLGPVEE